MGISIPAVATILIIERRVANKVTCEDVFGDEPETNAVAGVAAAGGGSAAAGGGAEGDFEGLDDELGDELDIE